MKDNLTRVDFINKEKITKSTDEREKEFIERQDVTKQEIVKALEIINEFMKVDYESKVLEYSALEQVILHTIEDASEKALIENAVDLILSLHDITTTRRTMKQCEEIKKIMTKCLSANNISSLSEEVSQREKFQEQGSSKKYYESKMRRIGKYVDEEKMKKALFEHLLNDKKEI